MPQVMAGFYIQRNKGEVELEEPCASSSEMKR
jgi:hypothetical protein